MSKNCRAVRPNRPCFPLLAPFFLFFREKKRKNQRKETLTGRGLSKIPWAALSHHSLPVWRERKWAKTIGQFIPNVPAFPCLPRSFFSFGKRKNALSTIARKPGCGTPAGLHASPPIKQEAQAGCSPPCWVTRIPSHSTGTERRVRHARVQQRAAQMVADEPRRAPAFRPRTVVFSIPSPPPYCNAAAPAGFLVL